VERIKRKEKLMNNQIVSIALWAFAALFLVLYLKRRSARRKRELQ
jgi:hypothetical protein